MPVATASATARRVLVYGVTGSGKSTAARQIGPRLGLPVTLVDELTWNPGWQPVPEARQRELIAAVTAGEAWVLDSAYGLWLDLVLPHAELVVGLDYPRWFSLQRLVRRTLRRVVTGEPACNGNVETWRGVVDQDSILRWHFRSFASKRERLHRWAEAPDGPPVLLFRRARDLERWIDALPSSPDETPARPDVRSGSAGTS